MNARAEQLIARLNWWEEKLDQQSLDAFRSSPPAFLTVSAKRKTTR